MYIYINLNKENKICLKLHSTIKWLLSLVDNATITSVPFNIAVNIVTTSARKDHRRMVLDKTHYKFTIAFVIVKIFVFTAYIGNNSQTSEPTNGYESVVEKYNKTAALPSI